LQKDVGFASIILSSVGFRGIRTNAYTNRKARTKETRKLDEKIKKFAQAIEIEKTERENAVEIERREREKAVDQLNARISILVMRQYANHLKKRIIENVFLKENNKIRDIRDIEGYVTREGESNSLQRWMDLNRLFISEGFDLLDVVDDIHHFVEKGNKEAHPKIDFVMI
jgi:hypothetical protein